MTTRLCGRWVAFGALLALSTPICTQPAEAAWATSGWTQHIIMGPGARSLQVGTAPYFRRNQSYSAIRGGRASSPLQCVPFARANSGIELVGNAVNWWEKAVGVYERGARPEVGSVLNFRSTSRMRLGHVAVVSRVINGRNVEIDHANWAYPGGVSRAISVVDVSPQNDWTAVRVALRNGNEYGSVYPTYGFIYDRPDHGLLVANADPIPLPAISPPSSELRPANERVLVGIGRESDEEVAEAADDNQPRTRKVAYSRAKVGKSLRGAAVVRPATTRAQPAGHVAHGRRGAPNT